MTGRGLQHIETWFKALGREPFAFQREAWGAYLTGESGLIQAPTGMGKTLAAGLGPVIEFIDSAQPSRVVPPLTILWITPLRALASDTVDSLKEAIAQISGTGYQPVRGALKKSQEPSSIDRTMHGLKTRATDGAARPLHWKVELRTSDTTAAVRKRQKTRLPTVLVTTPESMSLLLSYPDGLQRFESLRCVVVDEWHELLGSKRGVQV